METGRRRISLAGRELAARVAGSRVLGLELAQAVAALETDQPHGHLAILAETKSVTVARHRGLAHLVVEDLAAVAEIMRERAATEVAAAWVAAE